MNLTLNTKRKKLKANCIISGSKSESNRSLILQKLYPSILIKNISNSNDTRYLQNALNTDDEVININHAGTAMRFLTAFFASQQGAVKIIKGSKRMHNRPIKILVEALRELGAEVVYLEKNGYPPLKIFGKKLLKSKISVSGSISSQYISALMLIAPSLPNGLEIRLIGKLTSVSYIMMTLNILTKIGIEAVFSNKTIRIQSKKKINTKKIIVESDWSSASYWYSLVALSEYDSQATLYSYKTDSLQGDSCLADLYKQFGVHTIFKNNSIILHKNEPVAKQTPLNLNLINAPDIAQTIAVTCLGLGIDCNLYGLHTLKIKETDRLIALKNELEKFGSAVKITEDSLHLKNNKKIKSNILVSTYDDHRMAMSFAPLALKVPITILDAQVVGKSYQNFWSDLRSAGIETSPFKMYPTGF